MKENFEPIFELGSTGDGLAVKVLDWRKAENFTGPVYIAAFTLALFDTILNRLEDSQQVEYQTEFLKAVNHMIKKKDKYDQFIFHKKIMDDDYEE
jgi:hypothetical protein